MDELKQTEVTNCPLCGVNETTLVHRKFDFDISQCLSCRLVYVGPIRPTPDVSWLRYNPNYFWDEYLPSLGVRDGVYDLTAFDRRYAPMLALLAPYQQMGKILEIGCGAGFFLKAAERAGWQAAQGIELSRAAVDFGQEKLGLEIQLGTLEDVPLPARSYDAIALFDTIEHLFDPKKILASTLSLLRPGGVLILSTPNIHALSHQILGHSWAVLNPLEHLVYFSPQTLTHMLKSTGYTTISHLRTFASQGLYETMNPAHNQAPRALQTMAYRALVPTIGLLSYKWIQRIGLADELYFTAERPS